MGMGNGELGRRRRIIRNAGKGMADWRWERGVGEARRWPEKVEVEVEMGKEMMAARRHGGGGGGGGLRTAAAQ